LEELVASARAQIETDPDTAARKLRQALELWSGPARADLAYDAFAQTEIAGLEEKRWAAFETKVEAELARHRGIQPDSLTPIRRLDGEPRRPPRCVARVLEATRAPRCRARPHHPGVGRRSPGAGLPAQPTGDPQEVSDQPTGFDLASAAIGAAAGSALIIVVLAAGGLTRRRPLTRRHGTIGA
jgi:hypothetical protein